MSRSNESGRERAMIYLLVPLGLGFIGICFFRDSYVNGTANILVVLCRLVAQHIKLAFKLVFWFVVLSALLFGSLAGRLGLTFRPPARGAVNGSTASYVPSPANRSHLFVREENHDASRRSPCGHLLRRPTTHLLSAVTRVSELCFVAVRWPSPSSSPVTWSRSQS